LEAVVFLIESDNMKNIKLTSFYFFIRNIYVRWQQRKKFNKWSKEGKNALLIFFGRLTVVFASFLLIRVGTEVLTPVEMGSVTQLLGLSGLIYFSFFVPLWQYFTRCLLEWNEKGVLFNYIKYLIGYLSIAVILIGFLVYIVQHFFGIIQNIGTSWVVFLVMINFIFQALSKISIDGFNILGSRLKFVILSNLLAWSSVILAYVLYSWHNSAIFWVLGIFSSYFLVSSSVILLLTEISGNKRFISLSKVIRINYRPVLNFSLPLLVMALLWWVTSQGYKFIVQDLSIIGFFAVGYSLAAAPIALFESIFSQYYDPIFFKNLKHANMEGQVKAWNKYAKLYLPSIIVTGLFVASNGDKLSQLLIGEEFRESANKIIVWGVLIEIIRSITGAIFQVGVAKKNMKFIVLPYAVGSIVSVFGVLYFSAIDGLKGIALGILIGVIMSAALAYRKGIQELPIEWPVSMIIKAILLSIPMIIFSYYSTYVNNTDIWFTIISLTISVLFLLYIQWYLFSKSEIGHE
jgi:O-antigen/teichoic acid export membrane protein